MSCSIASTEWYLLEDDLLEDDFSDVTEEQFSVTVSKYGMYVPSYRDRACYSPIGLGR